MIVFSLHGYILSYGVEYVDGVPLHYVDLKAQFLEGVKDKRIYLDEESFIKLESFLKKFYEPIADVFDLSSFKFSFYFSEVINISGFEDMIHTIEKIKSDELLIRFKQCTSDKIIKDDILLGYLERIESAITNNNKLLFELKKRLK